MGLMIADCDHGVLCDQCPICLKVQIVARAQERDEALIERDAARRDLLLLQKQIEGHCERIAKQSELLTQRAGKNTDAADLTALRNLLRECNVTVDFERETVSLGGVIVGPNRSGTP